MSIPRVRVPIELDGCTRHVVLGMNALCEAEAALGYGILNEVRFEEIRTVRALLWAGLRHGTPEMAGVSLADVGEMADGMPGGWNAATEVVVRAMSAAMPDEDLEPSTGEVTEADPTPGPPTDT